MKPPPKKDGFVVLTYPSMTSLLHYFNPGHETAVLLGTKNYTPPIQVQRMIRELAYLPAWYAEPNDFVWVEEIIAPRFFSLQPKKLGPFPTLLSRAELKNKTIDIPGLQAAPWGLSPHSLHLFEQLKKESLPQLSIPEWKKDYFRLTGRQMVAICMEKIRELLPPDIEIPVAPKFCTKIQEIEKYLLLQNAPFVLKTPYSSSGRGLHWLPDRKLTAKDRSWIEGAIKKQGGVSIECALNKQQDFAMEFYSDGQGNVRYEGLSVFGAEKKGAYSGNLLGSQSYLNHFFIENFGDSFTQLQQAVQEAIRQVYGSLYTGYLGVDMLVYRKTSDHTFAIHPCIEVNMRYTMGMVALRLSEKYLALHTRGDFNIAYESNPGEAYLQHCFMKKAYPLEIEDGKIKEGYLSLCPVTKETRYRAYILSF